MDKLRKMRARKLSNKSSIFAGLIFTASAFILAACGGPASNGSSGGPVDPNETAAKVNGKVITMQEVERAVKQQAQGQESKMSPLELAGARLQVLQNLIEQEVMFQKAEKEGVVPSDDDVAAEVNKQKVGSGLSADEFDRRMKQAGLDDKAFREGTKKRLAIEKLVEKVTGRIEPPKDSEIEEFFRSNPEMFIRKRGVRLAAIVIDPRDTGQGDTTRNSAEAEQRLMEVREKVQQPASDFAALAREYSEDGSKLQGGDMGYLSEEDLKANYPQLAAGFMGPDFTPGRITSPISIEGRAYIFKLLEKIEKDENLTLESPNVRPQINQLLVDNRKQLLAASYQAIAMNEAKIENFLAQKVVNNPNELSGARPAGSATANTASNANAAPANAPSANANAAATTNANAKPAGSANAKPAAGANANRAANDNK
jgi:parvulin-like peptidyl-prolyl isomerase